MTTIYSDLHLRSDEGDLPITHGSFADFPDDPVACMRRLHERHGPIAALQEADQRIIFVFSPEYNQQVLSDGNTFHSRFFSVRGPRNSAQRRLTSGLLSMNGEEHKQHRRRVMGPFQKKQIALYDEAIRATTEDMLNGWQVGEVRDMHSEMTQYMLRITSGLLFGVDVPEMAYRLGEMIDRWVHLNHEVGMGAFVSSPKYLDGYDRLLKLGTELEQDVRKLIEMRRRNREEANDVLSLLIRAAEQDGSISDDQLVGHVTLMFGAAHLTTAHTFTWTLFLLSQHPSVMRKVHQELMGESGPRLALADPESSREAVRPGLETGGGGASLAEVQAAANGGCPFAASRMTGGSRNEVAASISASSNQGTEPGRNPPVGDSSGRYPLLDRVIKESMRILPASGYSQRITAEPVQLGPFSLNRGTPLVFSQFITHHRADLYPEPEKFLPDRWLTISPGPYEYLPFGSGPRMCLGGPLALTILKTALPMILRRFHLSVVPGAEVSGKIISTMLGPTMPVPMRLLPPSQHCEAAMVRGNIHEMVDLYEARESLPSSTRRAA